MPYSLNHDEKLVQALRKGDSLCFKFILDKLYDPLIAFTYGYTHDTALAEDIVQHCFMKLWEKRESLDQTASLKICQVLPKQSDLIFPNRSRNAA